MFVPLFEANLNMYFIFKLIFKNVIIPASISLSAQKMFFFFQTDSIPPTSYLLRHFLSVEHYCTEKAQPFHWLYDFDNCTYCNFSSLLSILQSSNIILFFPRFFFFYLKFLGLCFKARHEELDKAGMRKKGAKRIVFHRTIRKQIHLGSPAL